MKKCLLIILGLVFVSCPKPASNTKIDKIEQWSGVYLQKQKIGYSLLQIQKEKDYFQFVNRLKLKLTMMGELEEVLSNFIGTTDTNFALRSFEFSFQSKRNSFNASGKIYNNQLTIEVKSAGTTKVIIDTLNEIVYPVVSLPLVAIKKQFQFDKDYRLKAFDATILKTIDAKIKLIKKEKININNKDYHLTKMTVTMLNMTTTMWVDENGISRKEESPPAMTIIEESREQALSDESAISKIDILSMFSISVDTLIPNPRNLKYLKVTLGDGDFSDFDIADNYQIILQNNPLILEIKIPESIATAQLPIVTKPEFLKPTPYIQSDDREIKNQAAAITQNEKDGLKAVKRILDWVYQNINKRATASLPSALDVLKNREGDCNEHAILFAALCRAVGIPCQICVGLVYVNNKFYYHAWNKVFLNEWIAVDPTFGQMPVDATHIKLAEGDLDQQAKVLKIVGELSINILSYK